VNLRKATKEISKKQQTFINKPLDTYPPENNACLEEYILLGYQLKPLEFEGFEK